MSPLPIEEIVKFLKANIEPLPDSQYGDGYRASITLLDGLHLPCVLFRNPSKVVGLAMRRFKEEKSGKGVFSMISGLGYREIVKSFVTGGNKINYYDILSIDKSEFAFPPRVLKQIRGETKMSWTGFVAKMTDEKLFAFGTSFLFEFFSMPHGYSSEQIVEIINHSYLDRDGNLKSYHAPEVHEKSDKSLVYRERPYFECYIDNL